MFNEPEIKSEIFMNIDFKGMILNMTSIHDWNEFIPEISEPQPKEDFSIFCGNSISIKANIEEFSIDYTP